MNDTQPTLTPDDLARIEADIVQLAHAKAASTPGEWQAVSEPTRFCGVTVKCDCPLGDHDWHTVFPLLFPEEHTRLFERDGTYGPDCQFAVLAHNLPIEEHARRLLNEVWRLRAKLLTIKIEHATIVESFSGWEPSSDYGHIDREESMKTLAQQIRQE